jgi:hypothetical protein
MNLKTRKRIQAFLLSLLMFGIAASQWYLLATTGTHYPVASILFPMLGVIILSTAVFPSLLDKNDEDTKHDHLMPFILVSAVVAGFANWIIMLLVLR